MVGVDSGGEPTYQRGHARACRALPGLIVFRYDAELFYANANRFADDVQALIQGAPDPVRWLVLDCSSIADVDYSAGIALGGLIRYVQAQGSHFAIARADTRLLTTLTTYGVLDQDKSVHVFGTLEEAFAAYRADSAAPTP